MRREVLAYLEKAVRHSPKEYPITKTKLAEVAGTTRTTLDRHITDEEVVAALDRQATNGKLAPAERKRRDKAANLKAATARADAAGEQYRQLLALFNLVEANARLMGIDPERLYEPIPKPERQESNAGKNKKGLT